MRITNTRLMFIPIAVAALLTLGVTDANAGKPSKKTAAAGSTMEVVPASTDDGGTVILSEWIKTSKYTDLILGLTAECSLVTTASTTTGETSETSAQLRVWATIDGIPVGVTDTNGAFTDGYGYSGADPNGAENLYKVVLCSRVHEQSMTRANPLYHLCDELHDVAGDQDQTPCEEVFETDEDNNVLNQLAYDPTIATYLATRQANAFTWMALNVGKDPYVHHVEIWADVKTSAAVNNEDAELEVSGVIGNRTLIIEPVKASKREGIAEMDAEDGDSDGYWE